MASAAALIGLGVASGGQIAGGFLQRAQARQDARRLERAGELEAERVRRSGQRLRAAQRVAFASSGLDPTSPTALDLAAEAARTTELNALRRKFSFEEEARAVRQGGTRAQTKGITGGISTILGGAGQLKGLGVIGGGGS